MSRWFRFYDDALNNPKVQKLPGELFKFWVNMLCVASKNDGKLPVDELPFLMRLSEAEIEEKLGALRACGLVDEDMPHKWDERQFKTDKTDATNAERQARYRKNHNGNSNAVTPVTVTATRTDTDTEKKESRATALESDWPEDWFEQFWSRYPRREEKKKARAILERLRKSGELPWETLFGGLLRYIAACRDKQPNFIKQPPSWLNAGCWDDELPTDRKREFDIREYLS